MTYSLSVRKGELDASAYASLLPNTAITSFAVFLFFKNVVAKIRWSDRAARGIAKVSAWTFGVYLVHVLVREFNVPVNQGNGDYWNVFAIVNNQLIVRDRIADAAELDYAG